MHMIPTFISPNPLTGRTDRFSLTPAPYEKAQASDVICKRAAHPNSGLNQKDCRVCWTCVYMHVCMHACMHALCMSPCICMRACACACAVRASVREKTEMQCAQAVRQHNECMQAMQCMHVRCVRECSVRADGHASCRLTCMAE